MATMLTSNVGFSADINAAIGKFDRPIRMIIEEETNLCRKKNQFDRLIYNVANSDKFSEAYFVENELGMLKAVAEGAAGDDLSSKEVGKKFIDHTEFKGDSLINRTLIEDSNRNEISKRVRKLIRSYWSTRNKFAQAGLYSGTAATMTFAGKSFDLTTADGLSLFNKEHKWGTGTDTQSNYRYYLTENAVDASMMAELMAAMAVAGRQLKSESGDPLGYTFNKIFVPGNRYALESSVRKVIGTQYSPGDDKNDINIMHGGWQLVVLPNWESESDVFIVGSDESNENNSGSMFYDRMPFDVQRSDQFDREDNLVLHGRARMSLVHNGYKHYQMCKIVKTAASDSTAITL